jgi:hypothetical protein
VEEFRNAPSQAFFLGKSLECVTSDVTMNWRSRRHKIGALGVKRTEME